MPRKQRKLAPRHPDPKTKSKSAIAALAELKKTATKRPDLEKCFILENIPLETRFLIYDHIIHDRTIYKTIPATVQRKGRCDNNLWQKQARRVNIHEWLPCPKSRKRALYLENTLGILSQTCVQHRDEIEKWYNAKPWLRRSSSPSLGIFDPQTTEFYLFVSVLDRLNNHSLVYVRLVNFLKDKVHATEMRHLRIELDFGMVGSESDYLRTEIFAEKTMRLQFALESGLVSWNKFDISNVPFGYSLLRKDRRNLERYPIFGYGCLDSFDLDLRRPGQLERGLKEDRHEFRLKKDILEGPLATLFPEGSDSDPDTSSSEDEGFSSKDEKE